MCCGKSLQRQAHLVAIITFTFTVFLVILGQLILIKCSSSSLQGNQSVSNLDLKSSIDCNTALDDDHEISHTIVVSIITIFAVLFDIPSSMLLLIGTQLKLRYNLIPWLLFNALKMIIYVIVICIVAWCTYVSVFDSIPMRSYYGSKEERWFNNIIRQWNKDRPNQTIDLSKLHTSYQR